MSKNRRDLIDMAFDKMDKTGDGVITVEDLAQVTQLNLLKPGQNLLKAAWVLRGRRSSRSSLKINFCAPLGNLAKWFLVETKVLDGGGDRGGEGEGE